MNPVWIVAGGSLAVILLAMGLYSIRRGPAVAHPDQWDPRVLEYVDWIEQERGLMFRHPVRVEFLTPSEYSRFMRIDASALTGADWETIDAEAASLRALGLLSQDADLFTLNNELLDVGTLAIYTFADQTIRVRGTEIDVNLEVTLVHELVHAAQDQHFDIARLANQRDRGATLALQAMIEGDATFTATRYLDSLPPERRAEYERIYRDYIAEHALDSYVEPASMIGAASYTVGPALVSMAYNQGGWDGVNRLLVDPPTSERELLDPRLLGTEFSPQRIEPPEVSEREEVLGESDFGAMYLYFILANRIDPLLALDAADAWAGGSQTVFRNAKGEVCVAVRIRAADGEGERALRRALDAWAEVGSLGADVSPSMEEGDAQMRMCDSQRSDSTRDDSFDAMGANLLLTMRVFVLGEYLGQGESPATAGCIADAMLDDVPGWVFGAFDESTLGALDWSETGELTPELVERCRSGHSPSA